MANPFILPLDDSHFPPPSQLTSDDLAVVGSNLHLDTLLRAYRKGYFPWYKENDILFWYHPNPRMVLIPKNLKVSKSMRPYLNGSRFLFKINKHFSTVIKNCSSVKRWNGQTTSWISEEIIQSYTALHEMGYAHCAEAWQGNKMVGGLYGVRIGDVFFGESMFSTVPNASKFAFILFTRYLINEGIKMIDCQQKTQYLASLGATSISRKRFVHYLEQLIPENENIW